MFLKAPPMMIPTAISLTTLPRAMNSRTLGALLLLSEWGRWSAGTSESPKCSAWRLVSGERAPCRRSFTVENTSGDFRLNDSA